MPPQEDHRNGHVARAPRNHRGAQVPGRSLCGPVGQRFPATRPRLRWPHHPEIEGRRGRRGLSMPVLREAGFPGGRRKTTVRTDDRRPATLGDREVSHRRAWCLGEGTLISRRRSDAADRRPERVRLRGRVLHRSAVPASQRGDHAAMSFCHDRTGHSRPLAQGQPDPPRRPRRDPDRRGVSREPAGDSGAIASVDADQHGFTDFPGRSGAGRPPGVASRATASISLFAATRPASRSTACSL